MALLASLGVMAQIARVSDLADEQTRKTAEMLATMKSLAEQQNTLIAGMKGELETIRDTVEHNAVKLSCMEARDCGQQGECTDAGRYADQYDAPGFHPPRRVELTEHQKAMTLVYPRLPSGQASARTKSRWGAKLQGVFTGKFQFARKSRRGGA